jgi:hypothetical protein
MRVGLLWQYAMELRNMDEHCCSSDGNDRRTQPLFAVPLLLCMSFFQPLPASASLAQGASFNAIGNCAT